MTYAKLHLSPLQRRALLTLLRHGPMSRAEVTERLGVSRPRLSPEVASLVADGVLREAPSPESTGGRRGSWLYLGGRDFGAVGGVSIDAGGCSVALALLDGEVVERATLPSTAEAVPVEILRQVSDWLASTCSGFGLALRAVGVSIAADVDRWGNLSDPPPTMPSWAGAAVGEHFARLFEVPTFVENDVNVLAVAEGSRGAPGSDSDVYAVVKVSSGVGCGVVANGVPVRGADGHAGDIGHICLDPTSGEVCACGNKGCLEAVVSIPVLLRDATALGREGRSETISEALRHRPEATLDDLITAVQVDDPAVMNLLREAGRKVGFVLAALVSVVNPAAIFISTGVTGAEDVFLSGIRERIYERARPAATKGLVITPTSAQVGDEALGAATLACRALVTKS